MSWTEIGLWTLGVILLLVVLMVSIGLHEAGHMAVARVFRLRVPKFFVGFGPTLFSRKRGDTEYGVKAIPLGGFVTIEDPNVPDVDTSTLDQSLADGSLDDDGRRKLQDERKKLVSEHDTEKGLLTMVSPWKRILVFLAGPAVNLALGGAILIGVLMAFPSNYVTTTVDTTNACGHLAQGESCGAAEGGMMPGDVVLSVDGTPIKGSEQISPLLAGKTSAQVLVERDGARKMLTVPVTNGKIGINLLVDERTSSFPEATATLGRLMVLNLEALSEIPAKVPGMVGNLLGVSQRDPEAPGSIVAVGKTYADITASNMEGGLKVRTLVTYAGLLNIGLGVINLFVPLLPLDGGRIFLALVDSVKMGWARLRRSVYRPLGAQGVGIMTMVTGIPVLLFMALVILSDVANIFRGHL